MDLLSSRTLDSSSISTLALLAALPGPPQRVRQYLEETDAPYEFVPGDVTAVDGWTSIAPTGGTAGRWLIRSDQISLAPVGGNADDWARIIGSAGVAGSCSAHSSPGSHPNCVQEYTTYADRALRQPLGSLRRQHGGVATGNTITALAGVFGAPTLQSDFILAFGQTDRFDLRVSNPGGAAEVGKIIAFGWSAIFF